MPRPNKKSILERLYDGELFPPDSLLSDDPAYRAACGRADRESTYLMSRLNDEDKRHLDELIDISSEMDSMTAYDSFAFGFRAGALLMHELLTGEAP